MWFSLRSVLSGMIEGRIQHLLKRKKPFGLAPVAIYLILLEYRNRYIRIWGTSLRDHKFLSPNPQAELQVRCGDCPMRDGPSLLPNLWAWVNVLAVNHMTLKRKQKSLLIIASMEDHHYYFIKPLAQSGLQQNRIFNLIFVAVAM
jgi:hypothetical protein